MMSENDSNLGFTAFSLTESAGAIPTIKKKLRISSNNLNRKL